MTEKERMEAGMLYDPGDKDLLKEQGMYKEKLREFNDPSLTYEELRRVMKEMFADCGEDVFIERPFHANWGGHHVHLGDHIYMNFNTTIVDDGHVYIGDYTMFGPNVTIATAGHPVLPKLRREVFLQYNRDVRIGSGCWIGAGVIVCPGVTIGDGSVIGAGSVVTKDIPANVVAYGNPCRVVRKISRLDQISFAGDEKIDWGEIESRYSIKR